MSAFKELPGGAEESEGPKDKTALLLYGVLGLVGVVFLETTALGLLAYREAADTRAVAVKLVKRVPTQEVAAELARLRDQEESLSVELSEAKRTIKNLNRRIADLEQAPTVPAPAAALTPPGQSATLTVLNKAGGQAPTAAAQAQRIITAIKSMPYDDATTMR